MLTGELRNQIDSIWMISGPAGSPSIDCLGTSHRAHLAKLDALFARSNIAPSTANCELIPSP
ncbi:MAG TPA: hypothetical protein VHW69_08025 [Rhizomicrobium sp.]|nr:hypothetical protein [Rhizomicrobium sp.]